MYLHTDSGDIGLDQNDVILCYRTGNKNLKQSIVLQL